MFRKNVLVLVTLIAAATLTACSSDDDDTTAATMTPGDQGTGDNVPNIVVSALVGTWSYACMADDPEDAVTEYSTAVAVFTEISVNVTTSSFTDSGCTTAADPGVISVDYSLNYTGTDTTTTLGAAANVDITTESAVIDGQAVSEEFADLVDLNTTQYDIFIIDGNLFYAGNTDGALDGSSAETRPDTLDVDAVFTRVE